MERVPRLVVVEGARTGHRFDVRAEALSIGRADTCTIRIDDPGVSREHAQIFLRNSTVWVQDTGSRNGVFVNGKRIARPKALGVGDAVVVGAHRFVLALEEAADDEDSGAASETTEPVPTVAVSHARNAPAAVNKKALVVAGVVGVVVLLGVAAVVAAG